MSDHSSSTRRPPPSGKVESLLTRLWLALLLFAPNPSHGSSDYSDLNSPLTRVAEQNVASLCPQGLETNATNRHCRPQGKRAGESRFPYVCSVRKAGTRKHLCTATLVHRKWLVTTAHCVDPNSDDSAGCYPLIYCSSPVANAPVEEQVFHVVDAYLHEDWFGDASYGSNVAMLKLDRNANYPIPRLFREWMYEDASMDVPLSRWVAEGKSSRKCGCCSCEVKNRNNDACQKYPRIVSKRSWLCIDGGETDNWTGEKGSPILLADRPNGKLVKGNPSEDLLVGFMSFSTSDSGGKTCAVYTSVSFFRTWIIKTIGGKTKPSRCMFVPKAEPKKEHQPASQEPEPTSPPQVSEGISEYPKSIVKESEPPKSVQIESEAVALSPTSEAEGEPVAVSPAPEEGGEPVVVSPAPEAKSEAGDAQLISDSKSLAEKQQIDRMIEAIKIDDKKTASALIQAGLDPNTERSDGELDIPEGSRLLHWAAHFNSSKCAEVLLEGGSDADAVDSIGMAALHFASRFGYLDVVKVFLKHNANVEVLDMNKYTPLITAADEGHTDVVKALLKNNANVNATSSYGYTALYRALVGPYPDIVKILLNYGADTDVADNFGSTLLSVAAQMEHVEILKALLEAGASVDLQGYNERTALFSASMYGKLDTAKILLSEGASKTIQDKDGHTAVDVVCQQCSSCPSETCQALKDLLSPSVA